MNYRITVNSTASTNQDHVLFNVTVEKETSPGVWIPLPNAPTQLQIPTRALQRILASGDTDVQKRTRLLAHFRGAARRLPIFANDITRDQLDQLVPSWPVTVNL